MRMPKGKPGTSMPAVSVHLPQEYVEALDQLVKEGMFPSRAEAIRWAVRNMLKEEYKLLSTIRAESWGDEDE